MSQMSASISPRAVSAQRAFSPVQLSTIHPHRRGVGPLLEGRFALFAISAFVLLSATLALATAVLPSSEARLVSQAGVLGQAAERELQDTLDGRLHLHLKRLNAR